jgi:hypothetical protein
MERRISAGPDESEDRSRGVADDAETERAHPARSVDDRAPELRRPPRARLDVLDLDVDQPLRREVGVRAPGVADAGHGVSVPGAIMLKSS